MQFRGRASRSEFWYFALFNFIIAIILSVLDATLGLYYTYEVAVNIPTMDGMQAAESTVTQTIGYLSTSYGIAVFLPSLSLTFRRLHDIGKSAWWLFIVLVPILGIFILFYFYIKASQPRNNRYGSIPGNVQSLSPIKDKSKTQKTIQIVGIVLIVLAASVGLFFFFVGGAVTGLSLAIFDSIGESTNQEAIEEKLASGTLSVDQTKRAVTVSKSRKQNREENKNPTDKIEDELKMLKEQRRVLVQKLQELKN